MEGLIKQLICSMTEDEIFELRILEITAKGRNLTEDEQKRFNELNNKVAS